MSVAHSGCLYDLSRFVRMCNFKWPFKSQYMPLTKSAQALDGLDDNTTSASFWTIQWISFIY